MGILAIRTSKSRLLAVLLSTAILFTSFPATYSSAAKKTALKYRNMTMTVGQTKKISIKNKKKTARYTFHSSKKAIASVSKAGLVRAKKKGVAKITVKEIFKKKKRVLGTVRVNAKKKTASPTPFSSLQPSSAPVAPTATMPPAAPTITPQTTATASPDASVTTAPPTAEPIATLKPTDTNYDTPNNFDKKNSTVTTYGTLRQISYNSTTTGKTRYANVILPAGYTAEKQYPVLYLLHGIGGDHNEWLGGEPVNVIGNLVSEGKAAEMIVVMPNVRARANDAGNPSDIYSPTHFAAFDNFINDLRDNLMPYIENTYSIATGRQNTAIAGLSMGGRESLYIGLSMPETFGYIGAFEPAPGLLPYDAEDGLFTNDTLKLPDMYNNRTLVMIIKGTSDSVVGEHPLNYHNALTENNTVHTYFERNGGHDFTVWKNGLYNFVRRIF